MGGQVHMAHPSSGEESGSYRGHLSMSLWVKHSGSGASIVEGVLLSWRNVEKGWGNNEE
jgi:hypothetical protein